MSVILPPTILIPREYPQFPLPQYQIHVTSSVFSIGCDIMEHKRFQKHWKPEWYSRIYSQFELNQFCDKVDMSLNSLLSNPPSTIPPNGLQFLASRWAVKEATIKAFGMFKTVLPRDIEILHLGHRPKLTLGPTLTQLSGLLSLENPLVSISHTDTTSMAIVLLQSQDSSKTDISLSQLCEFQKIDLEKGEYLQISKIPGFENDYNDDSDKEKLIPSIDDN